MLEINFLVLFILIFFQCSFVVRAFFTKEKKKKITDETEQIVAFQATQNVYSSSAVTGSDTGQCELRV